MEKPSYPIESDPTYDYGISERIARACAGSALHVFSANVMTAAPPPLGDPDDPDAGIFVELAMLTDGRRGWLILVEAADQWDVEVELTEFVEVLRRTMSAPPTCVVRAVSSGETRADAIDLRDRGTLKARLEAEFARQFEGTPDTRVDRFLAPFQAFGYELRDELGIRRAMNQDD